MLLGVVLLGVIVRMFTSAIFYEIARDTWMSEQLPPLYDVFAGRPVSTFNIRQSGVALFLLMDPVVRWGWQGPAVEAWTLFLAAGSLIGGYALLVRRFFRGDLHAQLLLAIVWFGSTPTILILSGRAPDTWETFFLSLGLFLYAAPKGIHRLTGVPLAFGLLSRLLPGAVLLFLAVRGRAAFVIGIVTSIALLAVGQLLYGDTLGFGYPSALAQNLPRAGYDFAAHHENNSIRGLMFKAAAGWRLNGDGPSVVLGDWAPIVNVLAYVPITAMFLYLLWRTWANRDVLSVARRCMEFSWAIVVMLLISPQTVHGHMIMVLPAFAGLLYLWRAQQPRPWPAWLVATAAVGVLLVAGPPSVMAQIVPVVPLMALSGNASVNFFGPNIGSYDFMGFPGLGLIVAWIVFAYLDARWRVAEGVVETRPRVPAPGAA